MDEMLVRIRNSEEVYPSLYVDLIDLLARHDPMRLTDVGCPPDEYSPEAGAILARLARITSSEEIRRIVHDEFVRFFDEDMAGAEELYQPIAEEIESLLVEHLEFPRSRQSDV